MNDLKERLTRVGDAIDVDVERELADFHRSVHRRTRARRVATIAVAAGVAVLAGLAAWQLFPVGGATTSPGEGTGLTGRLAYTVVTVNGDQQDGDIAIVDAATGHVTSLAAGDHDDVLPVLSPDGKQVAFMSDQTTAPGTHQLYELNADGSERHRLTIGNVRSAAWSPDGTSIAVVGDDGDISIIPTSQMTASRPVGSSLDGNWNHVAWSPDGQRLLVSGFPATDANAGAPDLYTMTPQGDDLVQLTHDEESEVNASWSPDGTRIVYELNTDSDGYVPDVWVMNADGSAPVRITDWQGFDGQPVWSPDGRWIAFSSDREATAAQQQAVANGGTVDGVSLFVMDPTGGDVRMLVDAGENGLLASSWTQ